MILSGVGTKNLASDFIDLAKILANFEVQTMSYNT